MRLSHTQQNMQRKFNVRKCNERKIIHVFTILHYTCILKNIRLRHAMRNMRFTIP